jgi:hypothetical protein
MRTAACFVALLLVAPIVRAGIACPPPIPNVNVFIVYSGPSSGCTPGGGNCAPAEPIAFNVGTFGFNFACSTYAFTWNFGDGGTSPSKNPTHAYASPGIYPVTVTITSPSTGTVILNAQVIVAASVPATSTSTLALLALALAIAGGARLFTR